LRARLPRLGTERKKKKGRLSVAVSSHDGQQTRCVSKRGRAPVATAMVGTPTNARGPRRLARTRCFVTTPTRRIRAGPIGQPASAPHAGDSGEYVLDGSAWCPCDRTPSQRHSGSVYKSQSPRRRLLSCCLLILAYPVELPPVRSFCCRTATSIRHALVSPHSCLFFFLPCLSLLPYLCVAYA
jgi:hypothetical protein